jgi:aminoglycoside phosphotransferase (APT) family kinase protein
MVKSIAVTTLRRQRLYTSGRFCNIAARMAIAQRDDAELAVGVASWARALDATRGTARVAKLERPTAGFSNETLLVTVEWPDGRDDVVVRLPPVVPSFPLDTLAVESRVLDTLHADGISVPRPLAIERDTRWLGTPFLVMTRVDGRPVGSAPSLDEWLTSSPPERQRLVQGQFLATLAAVHRVDWERADLAAALRGGRDALAAEVDWWARYVDWAADGAPARRLVEQIRWCRERVPTTEPHPSLCWGDARLGNAMYDERGTLLAVLDWELATIGPAEMDLAWYLALDELASLYARGAIPGFLDRADAIAFYEEELGRRVVDLEWHEVFALVRSVAINDRQARIAAAANVDYPGTAGDDNPVLRWVDRKIEAFERST